MIIKNFVYLILVLILIYLILSRIFERESFIVKLVYRSVHQKDVKMDQLETLVECLDMIIQHPNLIKFDMTGDVELMKKLYYALLNNDIDTSKQEVDKILQEFNS